MDDATFYNVWRTNTPEDRATLISRMKEEAPTLAAKRGFVSISVLECAEDGRVLVEGRWQSKEAFDAGVTEDPAAQRSRATLSKLGAPEPGLFKEAFRILSADASDQSDQPACMPSNGSEDTANFVAGIEGHRLEVNGQEIHYLMAGTGPAVLLVHGYPESSECWRKVMPELAKSFTVIAPDTRGVGQSSVPDGDFSLEDAADDLYELLRSLGLKEIRLVGQDFGVQVVGAYAAKHREDVAALVAIESPLCGFGLQDLFATFWHFGFLASPFAQMLIPGKEQQFFNAFAFDKFVFRKDAFPRAYVDRYIAHQMRPGRLKAGLAYYRALEAGAEFFTNAARPPWTFPVLAIDGDHSMNGLTAKSFARIAPGCESRIALDCGHFVQEEQPEYLVENLLAFFGRPEQGLPDRE